MPNERISKDNHPFDEYVQVSINGQFLNRRMNGVPCYGNRLSHIFLVFEKNGLLRLPFEKIDDK